MAYKARTSSQPKRERPTRSLSAAEAMQVPGRYVAQWGRGPKLRTEFFNTSPELNEGLARLWANGHDEASGRGATWSDVVLHWQDKL